jgi:hypothetical protein
MIATFDYVFPAHCAHSRLTTLLVKQRQIAGGLRAMSETVTHHKMTSVPFSSEYVFPEFVT